MGEIIVRKGEPSDANNEIAVGIAISQRDAYAARFAGSDITALEQELHADPFNKDHIDVTRAFLKLGPEEGWFWALAVSRDMGYAAVHGFALSVATQSEVSLMELHVHPNSQRQGLGRRLAHVSIKSALQHPNLISTGFDTPVSLYVARQRPHDFTEHPARWYRSLGFSKGSSGQQFTFGDIELTTEYMEAPAGDVLARLERH